MTYGQDKPPRRSSSRVKISSSSASLNKDDKKSGAGGGKDDKEYNGGAGGDDMCENEVRGTGQRQKSKITSITCFQYTIRLLFLFHQTKM